MISDDEPIKHAEADLLMRGPVADRIVDIIQNRRTNAPLVLALHGPWGSGKSSVLGLVREHLASSDTVCVPFEPWLFNDAEQLVRIFFATVYKALQDAGAPKKRLRKIGEKLGGLVTVATRAVGHEVDLSSLLHNSPDELRENVREASEDLGKRIVILVDDVDRLPIDELSLVLKLIRLCGNFPFFTYVLAYDRRVVSAVLRERFRGDADYLDKIVQVEVPLPPVPSRFIAKYVVDGIRDLGTRLRVDVSAAIELFDEGDEELRVLLAADSNGEPGLLTRSLRDAKRFLNGLTCTLPLVCGEVDVVDFVYLELIRVFFPATHDELYDSRFSLAVYDSVGRDRERAERQKQHQGLADRVRAQPRGDVAVNLIGRVFPVFHASLNSTNQHYGRQEKWTRLMKAADPASVDRYFQLRVPPHAMSRQAIRAAIESVNSQEHDEAIRSLVVILEEHYDAGRLPAFLDALNSETNLIKKSKLSVVIEAIAAISSRLAEKPLRERIMSLAVIAALRLLERMPATEANALCVSMIEKSNASFGLQLTLYSEATKTPPPDHQEVKSAFIRRIEQMLAVQGADLFVIYEYEWMEALRVWGNPTKAAEYLDGLLRVHPARWGDLALVAIEAQANASIMRISSVGDTISLRALSKTAASVDDSVFTGDPGRLARRFLMELRLVPELLAEVSNLVDVARVLQRTSPGNVLDGSIATTVWARARARLEPIHGSERWWDDLVKLYENAEAANALVSGIDFSSSREAIGAIPNFEELQRRAEVIVRLGTDIVTAMQDIIGLQTPVIIPPTAKA